MVIILIFKSERAVCTSHVQLNFHWKFERLMWWKNEWSLSHLRLQYISAALTAKLTLFCRHGVFKPRGIQLCKLILNEHSLLTDSDQHLYCCFSGCLEIRPMFGVQFQPQTVVWMLQLWFCSDLVSNMSGPWNTSRPNQHIARTQHE